MIMATKDHMRAEGIREKLLCDLDMSGFAGTFEEVTESTALIRHEYKTISANVFWPKRNQFLQTLLDAPAIFRSGMFPDCWEELARENIRRSIEEHGVHEVGYARHV